MFRAACAVLACSLTLSFALAAQETQEASARKPAPKDKIELRNGSILEGRILSENDEELTIQIGPGAELTLPKKRIASFLRRSREDAPSQGIEWPTGLGPRDDWFRLRDADGRIVGTLHLLCKAEPDGLFRLEEQWLLFETRDGETRIRFAVDGEQVQRKIETEKQRTSTRLVRIERVSAELAPRSVYFREQWIDRDKSRTLYERVFDAEISHGYMRFKQQDTKEGSHGKPQQRESIPFTSGSRLPLLVREQLRRGVAAGAASYHAAIFDPMEERFELRRFRLEDAAPVPASFSRAGAIRAGQARYLEWQSDGRTHREWISAEGRILRIECNGVHLIAEPVSAAYADGLAQLRKERGPESVRRFGELDIWLPRATWSFGHQREGVPSLPIVAAEAEASVRMWSQERDPQQMLIGVAQDMLRRYRLDHESFESEAQQAVQIDGRKAIEVRGWQKDDKGRRVPVRIYVLATSHTAYALLGVAAWRKDRLFLEEFEDCARGLRYR